MSTAIIMDQRELAGTETLKVANETSDMEEVKICLYRSNDPLQWIPVGAGVFVVTKPHPVYWKPPAREELSSYHLKVFRPGFIDGFLCDANVQLGESVAGRGGGGAYTCEMV